MLLSHPSYSMFVSSAEERKEASHENWAPNYHHPPSDVDVAGTELHVYVAATVFIHTHTNLRDGYNYQWASCSPNLKVSENRLCSLSPFPATTPNFWTTWRPLSPSGDGDWETNTHTHASLGTRTRSPPKQDGHATNHHRFKGETCLPGTSELNSKGKKPNWICLFTAWTQANKGGSDTENLYTHLHNV